MRNRKIKLKRKDIRISKKRFYRLKENDILLCWVPGNFLQKEIVVVGDRGMYKCMLHIISMRGQYWEPRGNIIKKMRKEDFPEYAL